VVLLCNAGKPQPDARYQVKLITHNERYNDLCYSVFEPRRLVRPLNRPISAPPRDMHRAGVATDPENGLTGELVPLHPLTCVRAEEVSIGQASCCAVPLMPSEALQLHDAMVAALPVGGRASPLGEQLVHLEPAACLGPFGAGGSGQAGWQTALLSRPAAKQWTGQLLCLLDEWLREAGDGGWRSAAEEVLGRVCAAPLAAMQDEKPGGGSSYEQIAHFTQLILRLLRQDELPCLVFNFERKCVG
jgi:hypothetical protein